MKSSNVLLFAVFCSISAWAEPREDYKCFLLTTQGERVLNFSWQPSLVKRYQHQLVGTKMPAQPHSNGMPLYVKQVYECIKIIEAFKSSKARQFERENFVGG